MKDLSELYRLLKDPVRQAEDHIHTIRDLTLMDLSQGFKLVVACDSDGGIGPKEQDLVQVPGELLGRFAVRVPLMEILASGAVPLIVVNTLAVEMDPTGKSIIAGVRTESALAGIDVQKAVTGSTEDNVPTVATGMGVVVLGLVAETDLRPGSSIAGDVVVSVGKPKSAPDDEVSLDDPEIADTACTRTLASLDYIHDILPVGSRGIIHEQAELAGYASLELVAEHEPQVDVLKSAGPSTCLLASLPEARLDDLRSIVDQPVAVVGRLKER